MYLFFYLLPEFDAKQYAASERTNRIDQKGYFDNGSFVSFRMLSFYLQERKVVGFVCAD